MSERFDGLAEHLERYLGPARAGRAGDGDIGVDVHRHPDLPMITAATTGVRFRTLDTPLPIEFACSAHPGHEDDATHLAHLFADMAVQSGAEVEYDDGFINDEPLVPGTEISGLLAAPHPYADEMFNLFRTPTGELQLQFITLIPITAPEAAYLDDNETSDLFDRWQAEKTDLLDLHRASAV